MGAFMGLLLSGGKLYAFDGPMPFSKFYKASMKVTPGVFTVYQDSNRYFMEIKADALEKDILVLGDIARGQSEMIAPSSGVVRFSTGDGGHLNVTRQEYNDAVSPEYNQDLEPLLQLSNLVPVSFVVKIEAMGKDSASYIIELTQNLQQGGSFFSFRDFSPLSHPDPMRSGIQAVRASKDAVTFTVLRTQTDELNQTGGKQEVASAFLVNLTFQRLHRSMKTRMADPRIGFATVAYKDFGKTPYNVRNVKLIKKWNIAVKPEDSAAYAQGKPVDAAVPVKVYIDPQTPVLFMPYIRKAVEQWNQAFAAAGFKNVLTISADESDNRLLYGNILIKWVNTSSKVDAEVINDPRNGEILTGRININEGAIETLMQRYFTACGLLDKRVVSNLDDVSLKGELMQWVVLHQFAKVLGMENNLAGSTAYSVSELRNADFVKRFGITASVSDDIAFNYVAQPGDQLPVSSLIAGISSYDSLAIGWAYHVFANDAQARQALQQVAFANKALRYVPASKNDPLTLSDDLSNDQVAAGELGMKNLSVLYPQLESITGKMQVPDEDWMVFKKLSYAMFNTYDTYVKNAAAYIGGISDMPVLKGYNEVPVLYVSKQQQQQAFAFISNYALNGVPEWMSSKRLQSLGKEAIRDTFLRMAGSVLNKLISPEVLDRLVAAENAMGSAAYTASDLFAQLDHVVFKDFNAAFTPDDYNLEMQRTFVSNLVQIAGKASITTGLNDVTDVLHFYTSRTIKNIQRLAKTHQNAQVRMRYQLMMNSIEKDYLKKPI
ncbi:protein of unknown function [Filimonas lacunae]|uniref:DUF5117 domain-containing protein n=2 Tax=Filimonas lacunae TaxID=477680 RepID=A0A173MCY2_9BACT|nr:hypothetical protein FLA_1387 [Filimonas lacunae]SIT21604.1 protein of unknown function [Filimonas lacunae]